MFKLMKKPVVWWPVTIQVPIDGGEVTKHEVQVQYELISESEYKTFAEQGDEALLIRVVKNWKDIADENGEPLVFSKKNLLAMAQVRFARIGLVHGYMSAESGAPIKN